MRKLSLLLVVLIALLVAAPSASAWRYKLPFYRANNIARSYAKRACAEDAQCVSWGAHCRRVTQQRVNCIEGLWDEPELYVPEPGEFILCEWLDRFGVGPGGYMTRHFGKVHCHTVYE